MVRYGLRPTHHERYLSVRPELVEGQCNLPRHFLSKAVCGSGGPARGDRMMVHSDAGALEDLMTLELAIKLALVWEVDEREPPGLLV